MSGGDFEVEWLDVAPEPVPGDEPRRSLQRWLLAILVFSSATLVPLLISHGQVRHDPGRPRISQHPLPARLVACSTLVGTSGWNNVLSGPGCTVDGRSPARFEVTACPSGLRLWRIQTGHAGYWALTGVLFHRFSADPMHDRAYTVAAATCQRANTLQRVRLGSTALVETFDGDFEVTLSVNPHDRRGSDETKPAIVTILIKCVYGVTPLDSFSLGGQGTGPWREVLDPAQLTLPILTLTSGQSASGRAVFTAVSGHTPTVFWWGNDLNRPLVYWS